MQLEDHWKYQLANRITTMKKLSKYIELDETEIASSKLPMAITPYYAKLIAGSEYNYPLRRCVVPTIFEQSEEGIADPLGEEKDSINEILVHRYPDKVLLLATSSCATYCRYCTRSRIVGRKKINLKKKLDQSLEYIRKNKIRDVLISGGDPLTMEDEEIDYLLSRIREVKSVEIVRIGTKVPVVLPQRINQKLVSILRKYHPLYISIHFTHPDEITKECSLACELLANAGIPLGSQTVLLKGINDNANTLIELFNKLLTLRVRPYYLYQCDPVKGSMHFRVPLKDGIDIMRSIIGFTSGYAVPTFVVDLPNGGGKVPVTPNYIVEEDEDSITFINFKKIKYRVQK